jgi:hypothetical protein
MGPADLLTKSYCVREASLVDRCRTYVAIAARGPEATDTAAIAAMKKTDLILAGPCRHRRRRRRRPLACASNDF